MAAKARSRSRKKPAPAGKRRDVPLKITSVSFRSSVPVGDFQHAHVEAEAIVQAGETPEGTLRKLKGFVGEQLKDVKQETARARMLARRPPTVPRAEDVWARNGEGQLHYEPDPNDPFA